MTNSMLGPSDRARLSHQQDQIAKTGPNNIGIRHDYSRTCPRCAERPVNSLDPFQELCGVCRLDVVVRLALRQQCRVDVRMPDRGDWPIEPIFGIEALRLAGEQ